MASRWLPLALVAATVACAAPEPPAAPIPPVSTGKVHVRVYTEPSAVRAIAIADAYTFVATDAGLERWDDAGAVVTLDTDHGLPGDHVGALAYDPERKWLWLLTDGGLGRYDLTRQSYVDVGEPPASLGIDYGQLARDGGNTLASAADGGAWLGTSKGLLFVSDRGWLATAVNEPIRAMFRDRGDWLWIATKAGLLARKPSGDVVKIGAAQGCEVAEPRSVVEAPDDRILVIGTDDQGRERIAIGTQTGWATYRAMPELAPDAAALRGGAVFVSAGGRIYRIAPGDATGVRPLARDGTRLVAMSAGAPAWMIEPIDLALPPSPTALAAGGERLLIGTHDLGTARYVDGEARPHDWLRHAELVGDATSLTVACARPQDCWFATGARAWHWNGDRFDAAEPDRIVLAVARDPAGPLYALHRDRQDPEIHMSRIDGPAWTPIAKVTLTTPGDTPEISFARFASAGTLWVGLRYRDGDEHRQYGIAIVEPATGKVAYHRADGSSDKKMLPVPSSVVGADVRGNTAWFATTTGVARMTGSHLTLWTQAEGLRSEVARAVTIVPDGNVVVATSAGAGVWQGTAWNFPPALQFAINDVVATKNGQVWMATDRGIAAWDGKKVRRVDNRRGLAENQVLDVVADQFDRVWARGPTSLTLVSQ